MDEAPGCHHGPSASGLFPLPQSWQAMGHPTAARAQPSHHALHHGVVPHPMPHSIPCCWVTLRYPALWQCHLASHIPRDAALHTVASHTLSCGAPWSYEQ